MTTARTKAAGTSALARAGLAPRLLERALAAAFVGVSPVLFDRLVEVGRMPPPKAIEGRRAWCRHALDEAIDRLPEAGEGAGAAPVDQQWAARV
jgi:predicted DNA-binding transcriptional regulator AlpA